MARQKADPPKRRRWPRRLLFLLAVLALCAAALTTGKVQRALLVYAVERSLGADVRVQAARFGFAHAVIARTEIYDKGDEGSRPPFLAFDELVLDYRLWPADGRHIEKLHALRPRLTWDGRQPGNTNYDFLSALLDAPSGGIDPAPYVPKNLQMHQIGLDVTMPTWRLRIEGMSAVGSLASTGEGAFSFTGDPVTAVWAAGGPDAAEETLRGSIDLEVSGKAGVFQGRGRIDLPGIALLDASAQAQRSDAVQRFEMNIERLVLEGILWGGMASEFLPLPLRFDQLRAGPCQLSGALEEYAFTAFEGNLAVEVDGLVVGPDEAPLYAGPLRLRGGGTYGQGFEVNLEARLNREQHVSLAFTGDLDDGKAELRMDGWTRGQLEAALPAAYRGLLALVPELRGLSARIDTAIQLPDYAIDITVTPELAAAAPVRLTLKGHGALGAPGGPLFDGSVRMATDAGSPAGQADADWGAAEADLRVESAASFAANATLRDFRLQEWLGAWLGAESVPPVEAVLGGSLQLEPAVDEGYRIAMDLSGAQLAYADRPAPARTTLTAKGEMLLARDFSSAKGSSLEAVLGDITWLTARDWRFERNPFQLAALLEGALDLEYLAEWLGLDNVWGELRFEAPVTMPDPATLEIALALTAETLNVGAYATPYGVPLTVRGDLAAHLATRSLTAPALSFELGDDTRLDLVEIDAALVGEPAAPRIRVAAATLKTGLAPLVRLGYLASADGGASIEARSLKYDAGQLSVDFACSLAGSSLVLAGELADVRGVNFDGDFTYGQGLEGGGLFEADAVTAGGVTLWRVHGNIRAEGGTLHVENLRAGLLGGTLAATVKIQLFEPGMPTRVSATVENLDLEVFTEEFAPADVSLTGVASGSIEIDLRDGDIEDIRVNLHAGEDFTISRAVVEEQLRGQDIGGISGRALDRMIRKILGDADPIPFDTAHLSLGLENGRFAGRATLVSDRPQITFAIRADPEALIQVMKMHQQTRLEGIDER